MRYPIRVLSLALLTGAFVAVALIEPALAQRRGGGGRGGGMSRGGARSSVSRGGGFGVGPGLVPQADSGVGLVPGHVPAAGT
jgi:hypothetical protein